MRGAIGFSSKLHVRDAYLRPTHWKRKFLEKKEKSAFQPAKQGDDARRRDRGREKRLHYSVHYTR